VIVLGFMEELTLGL